MLDITDLVDRKPKQLSGGQRQRVAMGRAIVRNPKVFLFDEPLSNLDAKLRVQMRIEIKKVHQKVRTTTVYVTHDQVEAMTLADRVVVLRDGAIEQVGSPLELYDKPANRFVAQFIGMPQMNVIDTAELPALRLAVGAANAPDGFIGVRPENVVLRNAGSGAIGGKVELIESLGADTLIYAVVGDGAAPGTQIVARQNTRTNLHVGDAVGMDIAPNSYHLFNREGQVVARAA